MKEDFVNVVISCSLDASAIRGLTIIINHDMFACINALRPSQQFISVMSEQFPVFLGS